MDDDDSNDPDTAKSRGKGKKKKVAINEGNMGTSRNAGSDLTAKNSKLSPHGPLGSSRSPQGSLDNSKTNMQPPPPILIQNE